MSVCRYIMLFLLLSHGLSAQVFIGKGTTIHIADSTSFNCRNIKNESRKNVSSHKALAVNTFRKKTKIKRQYSERTLKVRKNNENVAAVAVIIKKPDADVKISTLYSSFYYVYTSFSGLKKILGSFVYKTTLYIASEVDFTKSQLDFQNSKISCIYYKNKFKIRPPPFNFFLDSNIKTQFSIYNTII